MKELKKIFTFYESLKNQPNPSQCALASVVYVEGSSYRRTGARMLVSQNGLWQGGISGGCLEGDALKKARLAIIQNKPQIIRYDTTQGDDHQIGVGLGCNGIIDVLFQPIEYPNPNNPIEILRNATVDFKPIFTITQSLQKHELLGVMWSGNHAPETVVDLMDFEGLNEIIDQKKSKNVILNKGLRIFVEFIPPPIELFIFGHQYDIYFLLEICSFLDWKVNVVAPNEKIKNEINANIINPDEFYINHIPQSDVAVLLMSHSYETDKKNLKNLIGNGIPYIGLLGPKIRSEKIISELKQEGFNLETENIFAPIGLDIGAVTPEEIALSMVSEIKAVFASRSGGSLRDRQAPINERDTLMIFK